MFGIRGLAIGGVSALALSVTGIVHERAAPSNATDIAARAPTAFQVIERHAIRHDVSQPLRATNMAVGMSRYSPRGRIASGSGRAIQRGPGSASAVEQTTEGTRAPATLVASFDGLGADFVGPQGNAYFSNPSDNSLAVGPNHIVQIVNSRMAIYTKKGRQFDTTGQVLYGPVGTNNVFRDFDGGCGGRPNGDAVVRYDQLANRWLIVMPIFRRLPLREHEPVAPVDGGGAVVSEARQAGQPGAAVPLYEPPHAEPKPITPPDSTERERLRGEANREKGSYGMCYAVSTGPDPFGPYYRYEFTRPLFPDYPRPAVWPDGYYVPTSTGDNVIQKHACVVDRQKMLKGGDATEQCVVVDGVNFLNNADLDGKQLPPAGAPNIILAGGGTQLKKVMDDSAIYAWKFHVDWNNPANTKLTGPERIAVAPYHYLCDGQLTNCVPQPGVDRHLDAQGDKLMARVVYRRIGNQESIVAVHSVNTTAGGGGVRWYELRLDRRRDPKLYQEGTYAPSGEFRWMGSPAMDRDGNIGIGYSFGGPADYTGQRFAARKANDPKGVLTLREAVLAQGGAPQMNTLRWEDYSQTAVDPDDDCTIWYVGDYYKPGEQRYSSKIGGFKIAGCR